MIFKLLNKIKLGRMKGLIIKIDHLIKVRLARLNEQLTEGLFGAIIVKTV